MGHKYSLILSRKITDEESSILVESGCYGATFVTDSLPTDPEVKVTKVDIDDTVSPSLEKAIESGLDAVIQVPDLSAPGLRVPALPVEKKTGQPAVVAGEVMDDDLSVGNEEEVGEANATQAANGTMHAANGATHAANGATQAANGATQAANGATQAANGATQAANGIKRAANGKAKRTANRKATAEAAEFADDAKDLSEAGTAAD